MWLRPRGVEEKEMELRRKLVVLAVALGMAVGAFAAPVAAKTTVMCAHANQGIHEITHIPGWPGTRAAHTVTRSAVVGGYYTVNEKIYTKSGWWDPTWDYYKSRQTFCST